MRVNVSRLDLFGVCPQRYDYAYEPRAGFPHGMTPLREEDPEKSAMGFGSAVHAALQAWYLPTTDDRSAVKRRALAAFNAAIGDDHNLLGFGERLLGHYFERYGQADEEWRVLAVEEAFETALSTAVVPPAAAQHTLVGRWDLVVWSPIGGQDGSVWHVQHKTTGASSLDLYTRQYDLAWHERAYALAIKRRWPELKLGGTILNLIRRPRLGTKRVDPDMDFRRYFVAVNDESIERFVRDAVHRCDAIERARQDGVWEQQTRACMSYNRLCSFHALCCGLPVDLESEYAAREADYVDDPGLMTTTKGV